MLLFGGVEFTQTVVFFDFASNNYCLQAEVKASLNRGTARDEKLQQTMNLTLKRLNTYQQVRN